MNGEQTAVESQEFVSSEQAFEIWRTLSTRPEREAYRLGYFQRAREDLAAAEAREAEHTTKVLGRKPSFKHPSEGETT